MKARCLQHRAFWYDVSMKMSFLLVALSFMFGIQSVSAAYITQPKDAFEIPVLTKIAGETIYGQLENFPHTFTFGVAKETSFSMQVSMNAKSSVRDVSLILIKQEKRGVSEMGRVSGNKTTWLDSYDFLRAMPFTSSPRQTYTLSPGTYRLEVSSPENNRNYRLVLGEGDSSLPREIFTVREVFEVSSVSVLLSPFVFGFLFFSVCLIYYRKKKSHVS